MTLINHLHRHVFNQPNGVQLMTVKIANKA